MRVSVRLLFISSLLTVPVLSLHRVRKYIRTPVVRSAADDDLDMAAAELVFKEKQTLKPMGERVEGPPQKLPFGTEHTGESEGSDSIGSPSAEPSFSDLRKSNLEEIEKEEEEKPLKSSMVGEGSVPDGEGFFTTSAPVHDWDTSSGGDSEEPLKWKLPLENRGRLVAFDFDINPEYPQFAPRARGLVGIPDGWNLDKTVDEEFRTGFRHVDFRRQRS